MRDLGTTRGHLAALLLCVIAAAPGPAYADEVGGDEVVITGEEPPPAAPTEPTEEPNPYLRRGLFLALGPAIFFPQFDGDASPLGTTGGFTARVGWRFHDYVALEALYEWSEYSSSELGGNVQLTSNVGALDLKVIYPVGRFQPFIGGGPGLMSISKFAGGFWQDAELNIGTELAWRITGGFDVFISEGWSAYADASWLRPTSKLDQYEYVTAGIGMRYVF